MTTQPNPAPGSLPPPIELMGALCSLLIHDFANHVSVISGNAQCAQMFGDDPQRMAPALASILKASEAAASLLVKCGELRRKLGSGLPSGDLTRLVDELSGNSARHPGWIVKAPGLEGRIVVPLHWVVFAVWELVRESAADSGMIGVQKKSSSENATGVPGLVSVLTAREFLEIKLAWRSARPFPLDEIRSKQSNLNLLAACELVKVTGGRVVCVTAAPGEQEINISVPLVSADPA